ncbi:MAG: glycosyltransferase family 4 protein [Planctomycetota bacterium]
MNRLANSDAPKARPAPAYTASSEGDPLNLAVTGYVSATAGSVAGANAVLLKQLLQNGHEVLFGSKPWYVDPRPLVQDWGLSRGFQFADCSNGTPDRLHRWSTSKPSLLKRIVRPVAAVWDDQTYRSRLTACLASSAPTPIDACLWLGTWAGATLTGVPTVSWAQGPPGTDARSIARHADEIRSLGGSVLLAKLRAYAAWRLGPGLPRFDHSDHLIVGSQWSREVLTDSYGIDESRVHHLPYPIDLNVFRPPVEPRTTTGPLRVLWLGRFVPRKRLPLFLNAMAEAIDQGVDLRATVVGRSAFVPNYERLIAEFTYPDRLDHRSSVSRADVPALMAEHDILVQPSDDENFGSSVAEAQACGMPVIVGATNGTGDYVCERSIRLADDRVATLVDAVAAMAARKRAGELADGGSSREAAKRHCAPARVAAGLERVIRLAMIDGAGQ